MSSYNPIHRIHQAIGQRTFLSAGAGLLLLAWLMVPMAPMELECELSFEPAQVQIGNESAVVMAVPSEDVGPVNRVEVESGSGLQVTLDQNRPLHLLVNASSGNEGDWEVVLNHGEEAVCSGTLEVTAEG